MGNRKLYIGFTLAILLVMIVGGVANYTLNNQREQLEWVNHTHKVLEQTTYVERLMVDMETGRRGFRCTGDKTFLEPYYKSQPKLEGAVEELTNLTSDNPEQSKRVANLAISVERVDSLWKSININTVYRDDSSRYNITLAEKILMTAVRSDVIAIRNTENDLLRIRDNASRKGIDQTIWALELGIVLILLIVFTMIRAILDENKNRKKAEAALKDKLEELKTINAATLETNWVLTGMRSINGSLIGNDSLKDMTQTTLRAIQTYVNAVAAAFYFYDPKTKELQLMSALALPSDTPEKVKLNEGILGLAATNREISVVKDIPAGYWKISSATGAQMPDTLVFAPLWRKNELKGIIEIAIFAEDTRRLVELLASITDNVAIGVTAAHANDVTNTLLAKVQEQKEELESQQEELRQTNEELTHQAEVLRASEEELKTQEEELRQINEELEQRTKAVEAARKSLQDKAKELEISSKYKSEFLANMSHELRTPLNSVLILASLLKENKMGNLTDKQAEYAKVIHKSGSDLLNLINDILDLSKIEAGKVEMNMEPVPVSELAHDMEQLFSVVAGERKISFRIQQPTEGNFSLTTDKQRIEQVIKNLLSNAFKFTPEGGTVTLAFTHHNSRMAISVADTGIGIPEDKQKLIFEAFQQADGSTSRRYGGTGLGLSISKELVARLGGEMQLVSAAGKGSTFTILMPLEAGSPIQPKIQTQTVTIAQVPAIPDSVEEQTIIEDDKQQLRAGEQSILIVEDDPVFARIVRDFAHSKGYKTILAIRGDEGLYYARKYKPSAIILDLGLPVLSGRSVLHALKSDEVLKTIPVHVITAEDRSEVGFEQVAGFVTKPLLRNELDDTFEKIGSYIHNHYRNVMVVTSGRQQLHDMFDTLAAAHSADLMCTLVETATEAIETLKNREVNCIIAGIGVDMAGGIGLLKSLKETAKKDTYIIACLESNITPADEKSLKQFADSIVRLSSQATSRLLDEVELFLHKLEKTHNQPTVPEKYSGPMDHSLSGCKVLLADDDMRNVFALTVLLEEQGMEVITAENGKEALEMLEQNKGINLVLMDIMMPEMDGYEAMTRIRAIKTHAKLPIIALTAKAMVGDREKCIEAGASDYITKPVDNNKLLSLMRVWLSN